MWSAHVNDLEWCDIYTGYTTCSDIIENVAASGVANEYQIQVGTGQVVGVSEGVAIQCGGTGSALYAGIGTINISNSGCANSGALFFANASGSPDARLFENSGGSFLLRMPANNNYVISTASNSVTMDYGNHVSGAWTIWGNVYFPGLASSGGNLYLCLNSSTGEVSAQSAAC